MIGGIFEELFSPGRKHTNDEHNRLALARDDDHEQGGPGPIDLDKGVVVIRRTVPAAAPAAAPAGGDGKEAAADGSAQPGDGS
ncbi:DUF6191 domain-containing protein [Streptodolium elevatio]|uniref:DUF6191 domain-containing protein n=1 Tax=Streptodolium elevatio TaxID=3157996 RepID=A0ABV3DA55_9ACTN